MCLRQEKFASGFFRRFVGFVKDAQAGHFAYIFDIPESLLPSNLIVSVL